MPGVVAFIGLGKMGLPMAKNLAAAGFSMRLWNRTPGKGREIEGALELPTAREAAQGAEFVVSMLADDTALQAALLGPDGFAQGMAAGAVHVGCSTISLALAQRLVEEHRGLGQQYVSAPVFGRPDAAAARALYFVPGGDKQALERCWPLFLACGDAGTGLPEAVHANVIKLVGNFFIASMIEMLGEGLVLAEKAGLAPQTVVDVIGATRIGSPILKGYGALIAAGKFEHALFGLPLGLKDVALALEAGRALEVPMPLASLLRDQLVSALARGRASWDWTGLASVVRENAGLPAQR